MSPDLQRAAITEHAQRRGMRITEWVEALDESGSQRRSPWWRRLEQVIARVEAGEIDAVLVWKVSRLARDRLRWAVAIDRIETAGGVLESATEALDTTTSAGRLGRGVLAEVSAFEAEAKGEVWREVHAARRARGLPHAGHPRLGYIYDGRAYAPDPVSSPLVVEAYDRFLAGQGFVSITDWAASTGLVSARTGRPWTKRGLRSAMDSGWAAGLLHFGGFTDPATRRWVEHRWEPAAHAPIITPAVWDRYQRERRRRGADREHVQYRPATAFAGMVRCSSCRGPMIARRDVSKKLYACETRGCGWRCYVSIARVEEAVLAWLAPLATDVEARTAAVLADRAKRVVVRSDRRALTRQLATVHDRQRQVAQRHTDGIYDLAQFVSENDRLRVEADRLRDELDKLAHEDERPRPSARVLRDLLGEWGSLGVEAKRAALQALGLRVEIVRGPKEGRTAATIGVTGAWERSG